MLLSLEISLVQSEIKDFLVSIQKFMCAMSKTQKCEKNAIHQQLNFMNSHLEFLINSLKFIKTYQNPELSYIPRESYGLISSARRFRNDSTQSRRCQPKLNLSRTKRARASSIRTPNYEELTLNPNANSRLYVSPTN